MTLWGSGRRSKSVLHPAGRLNHRRYVHNRAPSEGHRRGLAASPLQALASCAERMLRISPMSMLSMVPAVNCMRYPVAANAWHSPCTQLHVRRFTANCIQSTMTQLTHFPSIMPAACMLCQQSRPSAVFWSVNEGTAEWGSSNEPRCAARRCAASVGLSVALS